MAEWADTSGEEFSSFDKFRYKTIEKLADYLVPLAGVAMFIFGSLCLIALPIKFLSVLFTDGSGGIGPWWLLFAGAGGLLMVILIDQYYNKTYSD